MVSQMWPKDKTEKKLKKNKQKKKPTKKKKTLKFIILTSPRDSKHSTSCRARWKKPPSGWKVARGRFRPQPRLGFPRKRQVQAG